MTDRLTVASLRRLFRALAALTLLLPLAHANASDINDLVGKNWILVESPNFRVVTEQPAEVARQMIIDLENLRYISNRVRDAESLNGPPLTIVAVGKPSYAILGLSDRKAGMFKISRLGYAAVARIENYVISAEQSGFSRATILHEYHHFLMHFAPETIAYPLWYDEGMAEYWSTLVIRDGYAWFGHPVQGSFRETWLVDRIGRINVDTEWLFNMRHDTLEKSTVESGTGPRFYAQSQYVIHYFNSSPELRQQLAHYLRLHNMGLSEDLAVRLAFKRSYSDLDGDLRLYLRRHVTARGFPIGKDGLDLPWVQVKITRIDRAATYAVLADVIPRFAERGSKVSRELIETNLALHPDDVKANLIAIYHGVVKDERVRIESLMRRYPNDTWALTLGAEELRLTAFAMHDAGESGWEALLTDSLKLYRRAIQADSNNCLAFFGLGEVYTLLPEIGPVKEGIAGLDTAVIYEQTPGRFRSLARLYLRDGQLKNALKSMRSAVAYDVMHDQPFDTLLMENLELRADMESTPTPDGNRLRYKSGAVYEGPLADGKPHGKGKWIRPTGTSYEGAFVQGVPSGHGKLVSERRIAYEGEFQAGTAHGQGRISFPMDGMMLSYEGSVEDGVPNGKGVLVTKNGRLEASFVQGVAHGDGTFVPDHNNAPVRGKWLYGKYQWPVADDVAFVGGIDADGRREGPGWCRTKDKSGINPCRYQEDRKVGLKSNGD